MRVLLQENTRKKFVIRIPTGLALNRVTAGIAVKVCKKNGVEISKEQLMELIKVVKDYKKTHPDWKLVEMAGPDGEYVEIII